MRLINADAIELSDSDDLSLSPNDVKEILDEQPTINPQDDLKAIYEMVWGFDIPSPTCQEYVEHHKQCIKLMHKIKEVMKKYEHNRSVCDKDLHEK